MGVNSFYLMKGNTGHVICEYILLLYKHGLPVFLIYRKCIQPAFRFVFTEESGFFVYSGGALQTDKSEKRREKRK